VIKEVPHFFSDEESNDLGRKITLQEVKKIMELMLKDKITCPSGWTQELLHHFFDILGSDMLVVVKESCLTGRVSVSLNVIFFSLVPKEPNLYPSMILDLFHYANLFIKLLQRSLRPC